MEKPVSAADANRKFSKLLRTVREGHSYVVTSHGKAVAKIVPVEKNGGGARGARTPLAKRLRSQPAATIRPWRREARYEAKPRGGHAPRTLCPPATAQRPPPRSHT